MKGIIRISSLMVLFLIATSNFIYGQVTIGSNIEPTEASILDIKSQAPDINNQTSTIGGIVMPRVKLVKLNTLQPFIENTDPDIELLKKTHIGLMVYNLNQTTPFSQGLYIWDGAKWIRQNSEGSTVLSVTNGLTLSGSDVKLGGTLNESTTIDQSTFNLNFSTGNTGIWRVNDSDFYIDGNGNVGIGTATPAVSLDVNGNTSGDGKISVMGNTTLKDKMTIDGSFSYNNSAQEGKYLMSIDNDGNAQWVDITTSDEAIITGTAIGGGNITTPSNNTTAYISSNHYINLTPGRWLVKMTFLLRSATVTTTSTKLWIKTGLVRNISGLNYEAYDKYRDKSNASYPVYIETILDSKFGYTSVTGDIVIDTDVSGRFNLVVIKDELRPDSSFNWATGTAIQLNGGASENVLVAFPLN